MTDGQGADADRGTGRRPVCATEQVLEELGIAPGARILEAGSGATVPGCLKRGAAYIKVLDDSAAAIAALCAEHAGEAAVHPCVGDILGFEDDGGYDAVVCSVCIPSREDMRTAIGRMAAVLGGNGVLAVVMRNDAARAYTCDEVRGMLADAELAATVLEDDGGCLAVGRKGEAPQKHYTKDEMYALLLKEFEEFKDEGRDSYFDAVIEEFRKDHGDSSS